MKHFMLNKLTIILALFSIVGGGNAWAQLTGLTVGGVYHFTNVGYPAKAMVATTPSSIAGVTADYTNKAQLWYVETSQVKEGVTYYALRNLGYGTYLQGNGQSSAWTLANTTGSDKSWFALTLANGKTAIRSYNERNNDHGYAHIDGSSNVVGWSTGAQATQWNISKIEMPSADIQTALGIFGNVASYQTALDALFTDKACTELKVTFDENNASFKELHPTLQNMVRKVADNTSWEEDYNNGKPAWDADYAKKYRVQLYEPYNDAGAAASALGLNAHNSLNNPTGIFANNGDVLYVMVDGEIKEGASLYLAYYTGHGKLDASSKVGYELKQGLNVIPVYQNSSNFCVNYVVQTFDTSDGKKGNKAKARILSDYDPIKIHIEGGYINGYWNKVGDALYTPDTYTTWEYIEARATQTDVTVLGKYITLQFPLLDENTYDGDNNKNKGLASYFNEMVNIEDCINEWDNVMLWERLLLGVLDSETTAAEAKKSPYSVTQSKDVFEYTGNETDGFESGYGDYYNIHGLSLGTPTGYMYGGWDHCGYHYNTMGGVIKDLPTSAGAHWGPGHEIGHQHQALLTVNGLTEVTNNLFSNVVLWYFGKTTSRYNGDNGALSNVLAQFNAEGTDFFSNNIWAQTIMYYKLFLYYHVLGHNPKFYPRLFEMLRQDPMSGGYNQDGSKCLMHFYKKCCLAAGEDLTEFFRAHGFFEVMNNRLVGDYSNSVYTLTQAQIDAAIKDVKDLKYEENLAVLFITDATGEPILSHRDDVEYLEKYGETTICAEVGSYSTFNNNTPANYTYNISGTTMTMEGTGGVGFAILNEKGELIGFSDKKTFELSPEAADAIVSGKASIVALQADNTTVVATNIMDSGDNNTRYQLLGALLDNAKAALALSDTTSTKVGFYRASALTDLQEAYDTAKVVHDAMEVSAYSSAYEVLFQEYTNLINNEYARINITEGYAYRLTNKAYPGLSMGVETDEGDDKNEMFGFTTANDSTQLWYFEPGTTAGTYYLKNKGTKLYPASATSGAVLKADKEESTKGKKDGAAPYTLQNMGNGVFALSNGSGLHCSASQSYNIVGWGTGADATQWYITANELNDTLEARTKLEETIDKTIELINEMADAVAIQKFKLQNDDPATPFYISTNACYNTLSGETDGQGLSGLLDEETSTYFHSDYSGNATGTHYLQVDLGESHNVGQFKFNYTTRDNGKNYPTAILVEGSADGTTFNQLATYTAANDALPNGSALSWESPTIENSNNYRYLRFSVTKAWGDKVYFVMSTFGITNPTPQVNTIKDGFANDAASKEALKAQIVNALTELAEAQQLVDGAKVTADEYNQQNDDLNAHYTELLTVYNTAKNADFEAKKADLDDLIDQAETLIDQCGTVTFTPGTYNGVPKLQTTDENDRFYIWTNAQELDEGLIANLVDGNLNTYFHSDYSGTNSTDKLDHHLTVNLGTGVTASSFQFSYTTRHNADTNYPTTIKVYGSTDGENYEEVRTITGLPTGNTQTYNSETITAEDKAFTHLRFMVTANSNTDSNKGIKGGHPIFHMAEFSLTIIGRSDSYTAELNGSVGEVTTDLLIATYKEAAEAQSTYDLATTEQQLDKAIAQLSAQVEILQTAKDKVYKQNLQAKIDETTRLINACADFVDGKVTTVKDAAGDATRTLIQATYDQVVVAQELINAGGATQEQYVEATNALEEKRAALETAKAGETRKNLRDLTTQVAELITRCNTNRGDVSEVMLTELTTANQQALDLLQGDDLTAIAEKTTALQTQYTTVDTAQQATGKSTLSSLIADMATLISACTIVDDETVVYVGDVTEALLNSSIQAKNDAQAVVDANDKTTADFIAATETLQGCYDTLLAAKNSTAKAELRALIAKMDELINLCPTTETNVVTKDSLCVLQITPGGNFYISTNAKTEDGHGIANLVDNTSDTYFQSVRSGKGEQYLLVDAGNGNAFKKFKFSYRTCNSPFPYIIKVYGSNDKPDFAELQTVENLPTSANEPWESSVIETDNETGYRYLRFNITKSVVAMQVDGDKDLDTSNGGQLSNKLRSSVPSANTEYCFAMSEFDLTVFYDEEQEIHSFIGKVTEEQWNKAVVANNAATDLANTSAVADELIAARDTLQILYDALLEASELELDAAIAEAIHLLETTPLSVGYPTEEQREILQSVIDARESIDAIHEAKTAFIESDDIIMPESGKAYVFTNVHSAGGKKYLNYAESGLTMVARGDGAANDLPESAKWYCRMMESGQYVFVNSAGKYLVFKGSNNGTNSNKGYVDAYDATYSPITFVKMTTGDYTGSTKLEDLFGYVAFGGRRRYNGNSAYFVIEADGHFQQDTGWTLRYDNSYSTAFIVEEVTNYPFANTKLTTTSKETDKLLSGIDDGQTISTFSAPYATVIPKGVTAYYAKMASQGDILYLTAVEGEAIPARQGVILIGEQEVTVCDFVPVTAETIADLSENVLANTADGEEPAGDSDYALAKGNDGIGIYKVRTGSNIKVGKAFLRFDTQMSTRSFVLNFRGQTTALEEELIITDDEQLVIYDLYGRRVNETTKSGIYIVNGKKVFIK